MAVDTLTHIATSTVPSLAKAATEYLTPSKAAPELPEWLPAGTMPPASEWFIGLCAILYRCQEAAQEAGQASIDAQAHAHELEAQVLALKARVRGSEALIDELLALRDRPLPEILAAVGQHMRAAPAIAASAKKEQP